MDATDCPGCAKRDEVIASLREEIAALSKKLDEVVRRVPPPTRPHEPMPPAPPKKLTGAKQGAQPGHPPRLKILASPERVNEVYAFTPKMCRHCDRPLPTEAGPNDPPPTRFQVAELPEMAAKITEYQGHARTCPHCSTVTHEPIPAELCANSVGPRYAATLGYLAGAHGVSKRGLEEITSVVFDAPVSLGKVSNLEQEISDALETAHAQAIETVRQAEVKHADETGWKQAGAKRWLWVVATRTVAVFLIHRFRNTIPLVKLLGHALHGLLCTDRFCAYTIYPDDQRQLCWAHLKRNVEKLLERGGEAATRVATMLLAIEERVFEDWHLFRGGTITRGELIARMDRHEVAWVRALSEGVRTGDKKLRGFCERLYERNGAVWTFADRAGIEPTNNHGERVLRLAVLWRRRSFGCQSESGCRFVERILTVVQSLKLQGRSSLDFLAKSIASHRNGTPGPSLA